MTPITYRSTNVNGLKVFYRQSGHSGDPKLLLLHGYPSASHMFRNLIPQLADRFHIIAPDLLGFGQSDMPSRDSFTYTFDALTDVLDGFTDTVGFDRYALYVFDYGAPTGFRLALRRPERITAIITQNGNAYEEGLSDGWNPIRAYWKEPTQANRDAIRSMVQPETTVWQYTHGVADRRWSRPTATRSTTTTWPGPARTKSSWTSSSTTPATSTSIPNSRRTSGPASHPCWPSGAATTRSSCLQEPKPLNVTSPPPMSGC
jgi:pimeloyl-ACP methyl ester carboxylesterase